MLRDLFSSYFNPAERQARRIEKAMREVVVAVSREPIWVRHYGAVEIDPRHLTYWVCVQSDAERDRLAADTALTLRLRALLATHEYPVPAREHVCIGFESQETVDRESSGNWWEHWR